MMQRSLKNSALRKKRNWHVNALHKRESCVIRRMYEILINVQNISQVYFSSLRTGECLATAFAVIKAQKWPANALYIRLISVFTRMEKYYTRELSGDL